MRLEDDVEAFAAKARAKILLGCKKCDGNEPGCECGAKFSHVTQAYEGCIPRDFWDVTPDDVTGNVEVFKGLVLPYTERLKTAWRGGYGLLLMGSNGVGKTMFLSFVLMQVIRRTRFTAYYTTMLKLDHDIKRGFNDAEVARRLDFMLSSDFLAIDEMGKERTRDGDSFMRTQVERILKDRHDEGYPTLLAMNADKDEFEKFYGASVASILESKYQSVNLAKGDFRKRLKARMERDMGFTDE
jgi:DNA replication protein DnaC